MYSNKKKVVPMGNNTRLTKCHTNALTTLRHYKQWTTYSVISHLCQVRRHNSTNTRQNPAKTTPRARPKTTPATSNTQHRKAPQHALQHTHPHAKWRPHRRHKVHVYYSPQKHPPTLHTHILTFRIVYPPQKDKIPHAPRYIPMRQ